MAVRRVERSRAKQLRLVESTGLAWRTARPNCQENCLFRSCHRIAVAAAAAATGKGRETPFPLLLFTDVFLHARPKQKGPLTLSGNLIRENEPRIPVRRLLLFAVERRWLTRFSSILCARARRCLHPLVPPMPFVVAELVRYVSRAGRKESFRCSSSNEPCYLE